jgi:hypothetical protein
VAKNGFFQRSCKSLESDLLFSGSVSPPPPATYLATKSSYTDFLYFPFIIGTFNYFNTGINKNKAKPNRTPENGN